MNSLSVHEGVVKISIFIFHLHCDIHKKKKNQNKCWIAVPVRDMWYLFKMCLLLNNIFCVIL